MDELRWSTIFFSVGFPSNKNNKYFFFICIIIIIIIIIDGYFSFQQKPRQRQWKERETHRGHFLFHPASLTTNNPFSIDATECVVKLNFRICASHTREKKKHQTAPSKMDILKFSCIGPIKLIYTSVLYLYISRISFLLRRKWRLKNQAFHGMDDV